MRHHLLCLAVLCFSSGTIALERITETNPAAVSAGGEWHGYNKSLNGQRYSPLQQINQSNAGALEQVCALQVDDHGSLQAGLIVVDGVMYATTATDTLAIDPTRCTVLWRHRHRRRVAAPFAVNRGVAYYAGRLFRGTDDGGVIALDAQTGSEIWSNVVGNPADGEFVSGAPIAWNGIVIVGTAASEFGVRGRVIAYDALSGREIWRFHTVPAPGEPGSETWRNTVWNDTGGGGGGTWSHFALDPSTAEVFIPVANPIPAFVPADRPGDNLYTNSVLVLDALTGALKWWYQLAPNDGLDHDLAAAPMLYRNRAGLAVVAAAGKDGYVHLVDRRSHKLLAKRAVTTVDETVVAPTAEGVKVCPGVAGGVEWNGTALDPERNRMFVGSLDYCTILTGTSGSKPDIGGPNYGGTWTGVGKPRGWIYALDADTAEVAWRFHAEHAVLSGITATAGGVVLGGDNAGNFFVFNSDNGEVLKTLDTGGSLSGGVITYEVRERQYIAFTSGNMSRSLFGATGRPAIVILSLPDAVIAAAARGDGIDLARGQALYYANCGVCHGPDGDTWQGIDLKAVKQKMDLDALIEFIINPREPMPRAYPLPVSDSDRRQIRDIAAFLLQWQ